MVSRSAIVLITVGVIGVILLAIGVGLIPYFNNKINTEIDKDVVLQQNSTSFNAWVDPPSPVYMQYYFFHLVNPKEVMNKNAKPILKERGPYTYLEIRKKKDIVFGENGTILSYREPKAYVFQPKMSMGKESDKFTGLNYAMLVAAYKLEFWNSFIQDVVSEALERVFKEKLFEEFTVKDYLWGYEEPTLQWINNQTLHFFNRTVFNDSKIGLFYGPTGNGSDDGNWDIYTGVGDVNKLNVIKSWKGESTQSIWGNKYCNMINGTDGTLWHPHVNKSAKLYLFTSELCRSLYTEYVESVTVEGIDLYRFKVPAKVFENATKNPDNAGYCAPYCLGDGVLNVTKCTGGTPIIMSQPHFYQGDKKYIQAFEGLHPTEDHATVLDVEPMTGAVMKAAKRLQINMYIKPLRAFSETKRFPGTIYPILWVNESATIASDDAHKFTSMVYDPIRDSHIVTYGLIGLGGLIILIVIIVAIVLFTRKKSEAETPLLVEDSNHDPVA